MLRGRRAEQERIEALLAAAREGISGALVIRGEPGIGKTALLEHAAQRAEGMRVLRGAGVESEAELPFAGLHLLLRPAADALEALPGPQRRALVGVFGLGEPGTGDRFLVGAAVLSLLGYLAEAQPVLCLVDDAQWMDRPSVEALLFAARRLDREGVVVLFGVLGIAALAQVLLGRHREAWVSGSEAMAIGRDTGQPLWVSYAAGALASLAAVEGDEDRCREHAELAALDGRVCESALSGKAWAQAGLALLDLGAGRVQACLDRLQAMARGPSRHLAAVVRSVPTEIEAAVRLGRLADAREPLALFTRWAQIQRRPWIDALLARCQALTAPDGEAERHFERALALHAAASRPFEQARTALLYGEWLRRARRKSEARVQLSAALAVFEEIGSQPWAARARAELGASGARTPQAAPSTAFGRLTPQELQITQLAAQGLFNQEIAAQLILSPRTVAYHLYKAYPKLGISSRGELATLSGGTR